MDILIALLDRPGELITKRELMRTVWPDISVVEANLTVHVAALRRALGDGQAGSRYILNVSGRGYRFVAPVTIEDKFESSALRETPTAPPHNLPVQLTRPIGRDEIIASLGQRLTTHRLLTITGAGGIGKSTVALSLAESFIAKFSDGVWCIDLSSCADPGLVPTALATALRLEIRSEDPLPSLVSALRNKTMLLVLDGCEHVIEATANLVSSVLSGASSVKILATSREPLGLPSERVYRLPSLEWSAPSSCRTVAEILKFPAAQLLVDRATAAVAEFELSDADAPFVADLCRNLDGIPLAIEFAAARVEAFGVRGVGSRLNDMLLLLGRSHRAIPRRHRTIEATLDWSYQILGPDEQIVLKRLAVFVGGFTLDSASTVLADGTIADIPEIVANLVLKSLVAADVADGSARFRLLETTRAFALAKLSTAELDSLRRRHARHYGDLLGTTSIRTTATEVATLRRSEIGNIRAALEWSFSEQGDNAIGVLLAIASRSIWLGSSLLTECHKWTEAAIAHLDSLESNDREEMMLQAALGISQMFTHGTSEEAHSALLRANQLAEHLGDTEYQLRTLAVLTLFNIRRGEWRHSRALGRRLAEVASNSADPVAISTADAMLASISAGHGEPTEAIKHAERALQGSTTSVRDAQIARSGLDHSVQARIVLAQSHWHLGQLAQSASAIDNVLNEAEDYEHSVSFGVGVTWCLLTISLGRNLHSYGSWITRLKEHTQRHSLASYYGCALGFEGKMATDRGQHDDGVGLMRAALARLRSRHYGILYTPFLSYLAEALAAAGHLGEALIAAEESLLRTEQQGALWWIPEAMRTKADILASLDESDGEEAETLLLRALDAARAQQALSFELRTSLSLARLLRYRGQTAEARALLDAVYVRCEDFDAVDLRSARQFLSECS
ncbi:winged helix-turn-helix domain-containing protein (plasmid) [Bradyrhizobium sp. CB82]|uniref:ATP-binding protein n=1 Tax=Bradyrhizobium sp. CB82 TaxID=3039159 RepID=UPI0024B12014|nr:winged helix-turn-helix domain-containing protein [Bradyrhizobium sp. CB82]WFU45686.1 winged helix-turn-helix domain-containing protein [Bradyrhizobium sp. CB82]